MGNITKVLTTI